MIRNLVLYLQPLRSTRRRARSLWRRRASRACPTRPRVCHYSPSGACSAYTSPIFVQSASPPGTACAALGAPFCSARPPRGSTRNPRGAGGPSGPLGSTRTCSAGASCLEGARWASCARPEATTPPSSQVGFGERRSVVRGPRYPRRRERVRRKRRIGVFIHLVILFLHRKHRFSYPGFGFSPKERFDSPLRGEPTIWVRKAGACRH